MTDEQKQLIVKAARQLNKSEYGATAVKVELEGRLRRGSPGEHRQRCRTCQGDEFIDCVACEGSGEVADGDEFTLCDPCEGDGRLRCPRECDGYEEIDTEGMINRNWQEDTVCQDFILEFLSQFGLAKRIGRSAANNIEAGRRMAIRGEWMPDGPLRFCYFHYDQSVDSECTMTLMITNPEDVLLLPRLIESWNALGVAVGNGVGIDNAGMHMALLNDPDGLYDENAYRNDDTAVRYRNFKKAMSMMMPALYFLGATGDETRSTHFREPRVATEKYSAIHYVGTTLEFRVFDTCYDNPDQILDNFVVMRNCMRYWTKTYTNTGMKKLCSQLNFGVNGNMRTDRFYVSSKHIEVLNAGLAKLKPCYRTIKEIKDQRNFKLNIGVFTARETKARKEAEIAYKEYEDRHEWKMTEMYYDWTRRYLTEQRQLTPAGQMLAAKREELESEAQKKARLIVEQEKATKKSLKKFVDERIQQTLNHHQGDFTLTA